MTAPEVAPVAAIRDPLTTIRTHWTRDNRAHDAPARPATNTGTGHPPGGTPTLVRIHVADTLARWTVGAHRAGILPPPDHTLNVGDPLATTAHLLAHADTLAAWEHAPHLVADLVAAAADLVAATTQPPDGIPVGACPRPTDGGDPCGGQLRATTNPNAPIRCPKCGHVDTVDGWRTQTLGALEPMTTERLCAYLAETGVRRLTPVGLRRLVQRGIIPAPQIRKGRAYHDPFAVLAALVGADTPHPYADSCHTDPPML